MREDKSLIANRLFPWSRSRAHARRPIDDRGSYYSYLFGAYSCFTTLLPWQLSRDKNLALETMIRTAVIDTISKTKRIPWRGRNTSMRLRIVVGACWSSPVSIISHYTSIHSSMHTFLFSPENLENLIASWTIGIGMLVPTRRSGSLL